MLTLKQCLQITGYMENERKHDIVKLISANGTHEYLSVRQILNKYDIKHTHVKLIDYWEGIEFYLVWI